MKKQIIYQGKGISKRYTLVEGKQYRVVCKDAKQVSEMLETKCGKLC